MKLFYEYLDELNEGKMQTYYASGTYSPGGEEEILAQVEAHSYEEARDAFKKMGYDLKGISIHCDEEDCDFDDFDDEYFTESKKFEEGSEDLIESCKKIFVELKDICDTAIRKVKNDSDLTTVRDSIKQMYEVVNGKVGIKLFSHSVRAEGIVFGNDRDYTLTNLIDINQVRGDFNRLVQDLCMAWYRCHGGDDFNSTPDLINSLTESKKYINEDISMKLNDSLRKYVKKFLKANSKEIEYEVDNRGWEKFADDLFRQFSYIIDDYLEAISDYGKEDIEEVEVVEEEN